MIKLTNIINEITVNKPKSNMDLLKQMIQLNNIDNIPYIEIFGRYNTFEEWKNEEVDEDMDKNVIDLAKIFYRWLENGDIKCLYVKDDEEENNISFPKAYKKAITYGLGYNDVRIILHNF